MPNLIYKSHSRLVKIGKALKFEKPRQINLFFICFGR